jgi:hypothetical protein
LPNYLSQPPWSKHRPMVEVGNRGRFALKPTGLSSPPGPRHIAQLCVSPPWSKHSSMVKVLSRGNRCRFGLKPPGLSCHPGPRRIAQLFVSPPWSKHRPRGAGVAARAGGGGRGAGGVGGAGAGGGERGGGGRGNRGQKSQSKKTCPTFCLALPSSVRDDLFGQGSETPVRL